MITIRPWPSGSKKSLKHASSSGFLAPSPVDADDGTAAD